MSEHINLADQKLTIIIPSRNDRGFLVKLLTELCKLPIACLELLIIDSSDAAESLPYDLDASLRQKFYQVNHVFSDTSSPGKSRNEGISLAQGDWLAFLDTKTIPNLLWVDLCKETVGSDQMHGIWGKTRYLGNSRYANIIIASTYGFNELITVPGMIIKKEKFFQVGNFLPNLLAGEDTDWMLRLQQHNFSLNHPVSKTIDYHGIAELSLLKIIKKWYHNYRACRSIDHLKDHRIIYLVFFNIIAFLIVFNWNATFAGWNTESKFFIPNISKITAVTMFLSYFFFRAIGLPLLRGCSLKFLFSGNLFFIFGLSIIIDCIKFIAFLPSTTSIKQSFLKILHRAQI